ncbi:c-type cytochrome [Klebsiella aerogenes]
MMKYILSTLTLICITIQTIPSSYAQEVSSEERGRYLSIAADCGACHTTDTSKPFSGGLKIATPVGDIYSTNITPDKKTGIGNYTIEEFSRALKDGVAKDGRALYPAMPYPSYERLTEDDVRDLYTYFMKDVQPQEQQNRETDIPWPLNIRWPLHIWNWIFINKSKNKPKSTSPEWSRGAYLVQTLGHCGACHTPRGIAFQEKALDEAGSDYLTGGNIDNWFAPDLTGSSASGLGKWSKQDIIDFLSTGKNAHSTAFGPMKEVIMKSTRQMTDDDLNAIAVYLKSLPAKKKQLSQYNDDKTSIALASGDVSQPGADIFIDNCSACHRSDGKGYPNIFPNLSQNTGILSDDPSSVISVILLGGPLPSTDTDISDIVMPDFANQLTDKQVADVATFIRNSWGNHAPTVTESQVKEIRSKISRNQ